MDQPGKEADRVKADLDEAQRELRRLGRSEMQLRAELQVLAKAHDDLKRVNEDLEGYAQIVAHDLKEPLRGIRQRASALIERVAPGGNQPERDSLEHLLRLASHLERLVDELLDYSRCASSDRAVTRIDVSALLREVVDSLQSLTVQRSIRLEILPDLPVVQGNRAAIGEVFRNLIVNASLYTGRPSPRIEIGALVAPPRPPAARQIPAGCAVLYVKDDGLGISPEQRSVLFDPVGRPRDAAPANGSSGSGLAIAKRLVERHGGTIWVEANEDAGSTFFFTLRRAD